MGRSKKYRRPAIDAAVLEWKAQFGDKDFDCDELMKSDLIKFKMKHQFITHKSLSVILKSMVGQGKLELSHDGENKTKNRFRVP